MAGSRFGFLGVSAAGDTLTVRPCLPEVWHALALKFRFAGKRVGIRAEHDRCVTSDSPFPVRIGEQPPKRCDPGITALF